MSEMAEENSVFLLSIYRLKFWSRLLVTSVRNVIKATSMLVSWIIDQVKGCRKKM